MTPDELIAKYLEEDESSSGPMEMRIKDCGIHVWAIAAFLPVYDWDLATIAAEYELPVEAVEAVVEFYKRHTAAIDARSQANTPPAA
jgi:uncharacterized protein (DUF433 family)